MDLSLLHIVIMLAELKQLPAQTKHRAFILQGNVQSWIVDTPFMKKNTFY